MRIRKILLEFIVFYDFLLILSKSVFGTEPELNPEPGFFCRTEPEPKNARTRTEPEPISENRNRTQRTRVLFFFFFFNNPLLVFQNQLRKT
jgi:hypothetical protein